MNRNTIVVSTLLCLITFFAMYQAPLASSQIVPASAVYTPPQSAHIVTTEAVFLNETFIGPATCALGEDCHWILRIRFGVLLPTVDVIIEETLSPELEVDYIHYLMSPDPTLWIPTWTPLNVATLSMMADSIPA